MSGTGRRPGRGCHTLPSWNCSRKGPLASQEPASAPRRLSASLEAPVGTSTGPETLFSHLALRQPHPEHQGMPPLYSLAPLPTQGHPFPYTPFLGLWMKVQGTGLEPLAIVWDLQSTVPFRPGPSCPAVSAGRMANGRIDLVCCCCWVMGNHFHSSFGLKRSTVQCFSGKRGREI